MADKESVAEEKRRLRDEMRATIRSYTGAERRRRSRNAAALLSTTQQWKRARLVLSFLSFGEEIDTVPVNRAALEAGKRLAVPRVDGEHLEFRLVDSADGPWGGGVLGNPEPAAEAPLAEIAPAGNREAPTGRVLILVPGLAFDLWGHRLGRGKGFYDRFLSGYRAATVVGYCFTFQVVGFVPNTSMDAAMDFVVNDEAMLKGESAPPGAQ